MNHRNFDLVEGLNKISPRKEYIYRNERGQWYEGYDEHWDSSQRLKWSRIYKKNHRNKKRKAVRVWQEIAYRARYISS